MYKGIHIPLYMYIYIFVLDVNRVPVNVFADYHYRENK